MACPKIIIPILTMVFLLFTFSKTKEILVGGEENSWTLPSNSSESITHIDEWAENTIFERGDILIFKFDPKKDSVLRVTEKNFNGCNTSKPLERYRNKKKLIELDQCKPFYFVSGAKGHCQKGQKVLANVVCGKHLVETLTLVSPASAPAPNEQPSNDAIGSTKVGFAVGIAGLVGMLVM